MAVASWRGGRGATAVDNPFPTGEDGWLLLQILQLLAWGWGVWVQRK